MGKIKISKKLIKNVQPFYAINYDWNSKSLYKIDAIKYILEDLIKKVEIDNPKRTLSIITDYESFRESVRSELAYHFMSRREFEIAIGDLPWSDTEKYIRSLTKVSVYDQVFPNLDFIVNHLWNTLEIESFLEKRGIKE